MRRSNSLRCVLSVRSVANFLVLARHGLTALLRTTTLTFIPDSAPLSDHVKNPYRYSQHSLNPIVVGAEIWRRRDEKIAQTFTVSNIPSNHSV